MDQPPVFVGGRGEQHLINIPSAERRCDGFSCAELLSAIDSTDAKPNVEVRLWLLADYDGNDDTPGLQTVTSGPNGAYQFTGLTADGTQNYIWHPIHIAPESYKRADDLAGPYTALDFSASLTNQNYEVGFAGGT